MASRTPSRPPVYWCQETCGFVAQGFRLLSAPGFSERWEHNKLYFWSKFTNTKLKWTDAHKYINTNVFVNLPTGNVLHPRLHYCTLVVHGYRTFPYMGVGDGVWVCHFYCASCGGLNFQFTNPTGDGERCLKRVTRMDLFIYSAAKGTVKIRK